MAFPATSMIRLGPAFLALTLAGWPVAASGQTGPAGLRARGMAGAFVAVADDASAVLWNPAGLGAAVVVGAIFDSALGDDHPGRGAPGARTGEERAVRLESRLVAVATPLLGLSYTQRSEAHAAVGTEEVGIDGREVRGQPVSLARLRTSEFGLTLVQSVGYGVTAGATLRVIRGGTAAALAEPAAGWKALTAAAGELAIRSERRIDLDLGLMAAAGSLRVGLAARNLRRPRFPLVETAEGLLVARHLRAGVAYGPGWPGRSAWSLAVDVDLTRVVEAEVRRDVAAGFEAWGGGGRLGVRAGVRASTLGAPRPVAALGASAGLGRGLFVDAYVARGRGGLARGWGVGGRITY